MSESDPADFIAQQKDKRRAIRAPLIVERVPCGDGHKTFFGYAKNVSRGGLFIATVKPREPGETFLIEWTLPLTPSHTIRCQCEVVWKQHFQKGSSQEPGMGLRFIDIADEDGVKVDAWVVTQTAKL